ncbi:Oidioi.mRNA.OKI2018_I69.XSR.g13357.t1.cds [Oikopleura dioica]|uniref:Oidioi.mRNA.OKI2018_I69.XSR.g13357.t1.cds n=1 Tax=Oikopleura dioica TaxID=34765 RepID=A0ABN7S6M3_OIKDI|nr:Oidioi.mRNA.OKI2018_I69.XSR.g13357.t1.cds [Oikopleura dioica]
MPKESAKRRVEFEPSPAKKEEEESSAAVEFEIEWNIAAEDLVVFHDMGTQTSPKISPKKSTNEGGGKNAKWKKKNQRREKPSGRKMMMMKSKTGERNFYSATKLEKLITF